MTPDRDCPGQAEFGMVGLGVMGRNLVLNIEKHGFCVAIWNRHYERTQEFMLDYPARRVIPTRSLEEFAAALSRPRKIMTMVSAGDAVDQIIVMLKPLLEQGDILIDGGNSWFKDTQRRDAALEHDGLHFIGTGVSGGEEGARLGPSLMPGGSPQAYEQVRRVFEAVAAKTDSGPCVAHMGPDGAGHFVKMVHNGIEYAEMQAIAEAYDLLRKGLRLQAPQISELFAQWNSGPLESFLIELTAAVLSVPDEETGQPLVDLVLDKAGQKGTGKWTAQVALDLGVPVPTIAAAIYERLLSDLKDQRVAASRTLRWSVRGQIDADRQQTRDAGGFIDDIHDALLASRLCSFAQGMALIRAASAEYRWGTNLREVARVWKGGCIIRARMLDQVMRAFEREPGLPNLLLDAELGQAAQSLQAGWRHTIAAALDMGVPTPALSASLAWFDSIRAAELPMNLTQAQRDAFGAHLYERTDRTGAGPIHTDWLALAAAHDRAGVFPSA